MTKELKAEIQKLQDRIEQLEMLLGIDDPTLNALKSIFNLAPQAAKILGYLFKRPGIFPLERLYALLYENTPEQAQPQSNQSIYVLIHRIRKSLKTHDICIYMVYGGWGLDEVNRIKIRALVDAKISSYGYHKQDKV